MLEALAYNDELPFLWAELSKEGALEETLRHTPALDVEDDYIRQLADTRNRDHLVKRTLLAPADQTFRWFMGGGRLVRA
jgi:hypothetical protein